MLYGYAAWPAGDDLLLCTSAREGAATIFILRLACDDLLRYCVQAPGRGQRPASAQGLVWG
jgi:hypothetical protein